MDATEIVGDLRAQGPRAAGSDAERRAALGLAGRLRAAGRTVRIEPLWVRPRRALVGAAHAAVAVVAGVAAVSAPWVAAAVLLAVLGSILLDALGLPSPVRRLTPERATQNVVAPASADGSEPVRLVICASCDVAPGGILRSARGSRLAARLRGRVGPWLPGPAGAMALAVTVLFAAALLRALGVSGAWLDVLQIVPAVGLLVGVAAQLDVALSPVTPGAGEASAVAVALALVEALDAAPPRHLRVELVLSGASAGGGLGLSGYVRARRPAWPPESVVLLNFDSCAQGRPRWWRREGALLQRRTHARLLELCDEAARERPDLAAAAWAGDAATVPGSARMRGWSALTLGCLDEHGDRAAARGVDAGAGEAVLAFALAFVRRLDADVGARPAARPAAEPASPAAR